MWPAPSRRPRIPSYRRWGTKPTLPSAISRRISRAPTPSAAAELAVPDTRQLLGRLTQLQARLMQAADARIRQESRRLENLAARRCLKTPLFYVEERSMRLDYTAKAFARSAGICIAKAERRLAGRCRQAGRAQSPQG